MLSRIGRWITLALFLAPHIALAADDAADLAELAGNWKTVKLGMNGELTDPARDGISGVRIRGDKMLLLQDGKPLEVEIKLKVVSTTAPKLIDLTLPEGRLVEGIYKLEGKRWTICIRGESDIKDRPAAFETKANDGLVLAVLEKVAD